ncbi:MAG: hypothetical protein HYW07_08205 [Candidatus Latescibacteria bacterium]|nr:hypothetical protein [Candidatus Latescibacterota bacterium]
MIWLLVCALLWWSTPALAEFRCAGFQAWAANPEGTAAKPARIHQAGIDFRPAERPGGQGP